MPNPNLTPKPLPPWKKWGRIILIIYSALLVGSWLVMMVTDYIADDDSDYQTTLVEVIDRKGRSQATQIAWLEEGNQTSRTPVVLVHNSADGFDTMLPLMRELSGDRRVLLPDLPGFGNSPMRHADVSLTGQSAALTEWMNALGIEQADIVGHRLGAAVAMTLASSHPEQVRSITMHSGIGVQEYHLMGDYFLNHGVHVTRMAAHWTIRYLVPQFGLVPNRLADSVHAAKYLHSDLRPIRGLLDEWQGPLLILHDKDDPIAPYAAAREHARLVPQSGLVEIGEDAGSIALEMFLRKVDAGQSVTREDADSARITLAAEPFSEHREPTVSGVSLWIYLGLLAISTHVSEDLACIGAGLLVADEILPFHWAVLACFLGIYLGDIPVYLAGRWLGKEALRKRPLRWMLSEERVEETAKIFDRFGASIIIVTRFIPGTRLPTYFTAGVLGIPLTTFLVNFFIACAIWVPLMIWLSMLLGSAMLDWFEAFRGYAIPILFAIIAAVWIGLRLGGKVVAKKVHAHHDHHQ